MNELTLRSVLETLPKARLVELGRYFGVGLDVGGTREAHIDTLDESRQLRLREVAAWMGRDELRRACERHGLAAKERSRAVLSTRLLEASGIKDSIPVPAIFGGRDFERLAPRVGDIVQVRQRQYLVERVVPPPEPEHATLVGLVCLDDDNQGRPLVSDSVVCICSANTVGMFGKVPQDRFDELVVSGNNHRVHVSVSVDGEGGPPTNQSPCNPAPKRFAVSPSEMRSGAEP